MHKTTALTLRDLSFGRQNILGWHLSWIKSVFLLKSSLLSKTVPRYLYSVTLSTFAPSIKRSEINQHFLCFLYIQVTGIIPALVTEPFNFSKINRIWVGKIFHCRIANWYTSVDTMFLILASQGNPNCFSDSEAQSIDSAFVKISVGPLKNIILKGFPSSSSPAKQ